MPSVLDILRPSVVTGLMNEIRTPFDRFQDHFGLGPKGPNCMPSEVRQVSIDVVNDDRSLSAFTAPGADASVIAPLVIGNRPVTCPRTFERMDLDFERLNNIRAIGRGASELDRSGLTYLKQQGGHMMRRTRRWREFLIWGMQRGSIQFKISNNEWVPVLTGGNVTIDFQFAADHKDQLGGIIDVAWNNVAADIISHLGKIDAKAEEDSGQPITDAWCNSATWVNVIQNTSVRNTGGSAASPFASWTSQYQDIDDYGGPGTGVRGNKTEQTAVLKGYPSVVWHITNRGISLEGTFRKYYGDGEVAFHPAVDGAWFQGYEVKESTNQNYGQAPVDAYGSASWIKYPVDADTPKYLLYSLDNFFCGVNPRAPFFATVIF